MQAWRTTKVLRPYGQSAFPTCRYFQGHHGLLVFESSNVIVADPLAHDAPDATFPASVRISTVLSCFANYLPPSTNDTLPSHHR